MHCQICMCAAFGHEGDRISLVPKNAKARMRDTVERGEGEAERKKARHYYSAKGLKWFLYPHIF